MTVSLESNQRVIACGKTGSGKTTLARYICRPVHRLIVLDSKGTLADWGLDEYDRDSRRELQRGENIRVRVVCPTNEGPEFWAEIFSLALEIGNVTLYVDELYAVLPEGGRPPAVMRACWTQGREYGIGAWASTQRPAWVPLFTLSEADHFFCFRLQLEADRKRMAEFMGEEVLSTIRDPHGFYYMPAVDDSPTYVAELDTKRKEVQVKNV